LKYSLLFRIWHWLNALVVIALVFTVWLRWTFLSKNTNADILTDKLFDMDIDITQSQAIVLSKAIRSGMWDWHIYLGYMFLALVLFRAVLYFKDSSIKEKFNDLNLHYKIVRISYYILYTSFFVMLVSGLLVHFYKDLGLTRDLAHTIKEVHEIVYYYIVYFIPLHIIGVFIAENTDKNGLVSSMINGK